MTAIRSRHVTLPEVKYFKYYRTKVARGIPTSPVDAEPIRLHVETLLGYGMTIAMIARAAGCSDTIIGQILDAAWPTARRETAARILSVTTTPHPAQRICLTIGARRRVEALNAIGWTRTTLASKIGTTPGALSHALENERISYPTWVSIKALFDELSGTPGPSKVGVDRSRARGFRAPLAWDGIDIDHPDSEPRIGIDPGDSKLGPRTSKPRKRDDHCRNGHQYTHENTYYRPNGTRLCRTCKNNNRRATRQATRNATQHRD
ncbi:hypothetical protein [Nocardia wallacei]|uniref:hypothetical protein n=1 Tax=Nocardia wallacei TaxID=480035 RepID=UPI00245873D9|nr:hypothetical protein [Nocardia wallacei]